MTPKPKFADGEKVLCFHGPLIYEAKALKYTTTKDKQIKYYIHYAGWNKNWDEWVPENRVLKYNEANVQRQNEVFNQHQTSGKSKKAAAKGKKSETSVSTPKDGALSSGGSESRASTPSKEMGSTTPLAAPATARSRAKQNATPSGLATKDAAAAAETAGKKDAEKDLAKDEAAVVAASGNSSTKDDAQQKKKRGSSLSQSATEKAATAVVGSSSGSSSSNNVNAKAASEPFVENEETYLSKVEVKIKIPDELKQCLADDWDAISRQHKLLDIPAKISVQDIVDQYMAFKRNAKSNNALKEVAITDVLNGVIEYFNVMLGSQLLYKFERPQYAEILQQHPETPLSKIYGAFHLLRLFVKLGGMLGFSSLDEKSMQVLLAHLHDFLKFLVKNSATFFSMSNFVNVSTEYHRNTQ